MFHDNLNSNELNYFVILILFCMKRIKFYRKAEIWLISLICVLLFVATLCVSWSKTLYAKYLFFGIIALGIVYFAMYIRVSYLYDNLSLKVKNSIARKKEQENFNKAVLYVKEEKFGRKSRFVRRFGEKTYNEFVKLGIITSTGNEWNVTDFGFFYIEGMKLPD